MIPLWLRFEPKLVGKGQECVKIKLSFCFVPTRLEIQNLKKMKKNSKYKTIPRWLNYKPKYSGKGCEREKIKIIIPFLSYPTPKRKFQNKQIKNSKN